MFFPPRYKAGEQMACSDYSNNEGSILSKSMITSISTVTKYKDVFFSQDIRWVSKWHVVITQTPRGVF